MSTGSYLLAPMELNALMINTQVLTLPFRRWRTQYTNLTKFISPIPGAFQGEISTTFNSNPSNKGIYLHWSVPKSLRQGVAEGANASPVFPMLPNRWLVVRFYGNPAQRQAKAWIIESDCPNNDATYGPTDSTLYMVDPNIVNAWIASASPTRQTMGQQLVSPGSSANASTLYTVFLGKPFDLAGWTEQGISQQFLQAVAPGNSEFTAYQPNVGNIFSFHDRVQNDSGVTENMPLSYFVAGWYSNPSVDPMNGWVSTGTTEAYHSLVSQLGWQIAPNASVQANALICHSLVYNIVWQNSALPTQQIQTVTDLHVAIGNNVIDAFQNMVNQQLTDAEAADPTLAPKLAGFPDISHMLEAFMYDMVYLLDQPGGAAKLQNRIIQEWFGPKQGGYTWTITSEGSTSLAPTDQAALAAEIQLELPWLTQLNATQQQYDTTYQQLSQAQRDLYGVWFKYQTWKQIASFAKPPGVTEAQFIAALDPSNTTSLPYKVQQLSTQLSALAAQLPQPTYLTPTDTPETALQNGIDAFMQIKRNAGTLSATRFLKPLNQPNHWMPNDPVVLITGAHNTQTVLSTTLLPVRVDGQTITAFTDPSKGTVSASNLGPALPPLSNSNLPASISALYLEAFLLDPVNAPSISSLIPGSTVSEVQNLINAHAPANYIGTLPALAMQNWTQPWNPLYFEWKVKFLPIGPTDNGGAANWTFDGTDYHYVGAVPSAPQNYDVGGRSILTSQISSVFKDRLQQYITANPNNAAFAEIEALLDSSNWDFLAQSFTGFNRFLSELQETSNRTPYVDTINGNTVDLPTLIGPQTSVLPLVPSTTAQTFQGLRRGQMYVQQIIIYDAFGQVLNVVESSGTGLKSYMNFHPILGPEFTPDQFIQNQNTFRFVQLPPRFLQPARLNFDLVDVTTPSKLVTVDPTANPVAGWLLPNHLENGISLYSNSGQSLGTIVLRVGANGAKSVSWEAPPHNSIQNPNDIGTVAPLLGQWYTALQAAGVDAFEAFLDAIDQTLWTVDPLGARTDQNLSVLIGRPLALVRATLQFQFQGAPNRDQNWSATFNTSTPSYTQELFQIRLGEQELRDDGLIGYYLNQNYNTFNNVYTPDGSSDPYLDPITTGNYISLPFDGSTKADVMLLLDPRAAVNAVTGIFPVHSLVLPNTFVDPVLSNMEIAFRIAPLLTELLSNPDVSATDTVPNAIQLPTPAEQNGTWSWWEMNQTTPVEMALKQVGDEADLTDTPKTLRDGYLQLAIDIES